MQAWVNKKNECTFDVLSGREGLELREPNWQTFHTKHLPQFVCVLGCDEFFSENLTATVQLAGDT